MEFARNHIALILVKQLVVLLVPNLPYFCRSIRVGKHTFLLAFILLPHCLRLAKGGQEIGGHCYQTGQ